MNKGVERGDNALEVGQTWDAQLRNILVRLLISCMHPDLVQLWPQFSRNYIIQHQAINYNPIDMLTCCLILGIGKTKAVN